MFLLLLLLSLICLLSTHLTLLLLCLTSCNYRRTLPLRLRGGWGIRVGDGEGWLFVCWCFFSSLMLLYIASVCWSRQCCCCCCLLFSSLLLLLTLHRLLLFFFFWKSNVLCKQCLGGDIGKPCQMAKHRSRPQPSNQMLFLLIVASCCRPIAGVTYIVLCYCWSSGFTLKIEQE